MALGHQVQGEQCLIVLYGTTTLRQAPDATDASKLNAGAVRERTSVREGLPAAEHAPETPCGAKACNAC